MIASEKTSLFHLSFCWLFQSRISGFPFSQFDDDPREGGTMGRFWYIYLRIYHTKTTIHVGKYIIFTIHGSVIGLV